MEGHYFLFMGIYNHRFSWAHIHIQTQNSMTCMCQTNVLTKICT